MTTLEAVARNTSLYRCTCGKRHRRIRPQPLMIGCSTEWPQTEPVESAVRGCTMGDIARELIGQGANSTYKRVHSQVRTWRLRGKLPEPDASVDATPYWRRSTITDWMGQESERTMTTEIEDSPDQTARMTTLEWAITAHRRKPRRSPRRNKISRLQPARCH